MSAVFNFYFKKLLPAMLAVIVMLCCTGCGGEKTSYSEFDNVETDVVFILGCGNNRSPTIIHNSFENYKTRSVIDIVSEYGGTVTFITNEGEPAARNTAIEAISSAYTPAQKKKIVAQRAQQITDAAKSAKATTEETNLIKAIKTACAYLANSSGKQKLIFIADNALMQTDGIVNFSEINLSETENSQIVEYLHKECVFDGYLDLENVQVQWMGFSATGGNQTEPTPEMIIKMEQLWKEILTTAGADVCINSSVDIGWAANNSQLPYVSTVYIPENNFNLDTVKRVGEDKLLFLPDSTVFADPQAAYATLEPYVEFLNSNTSVKIVVAGMTATQNDAAACKKLSLMRAEKVRDVFTEKGILAERIYVAGLGCEANDYRVADVSEDGTLDQTAAKQNRCILIVNADCDAGRELIMLGGE